ncbi:glycosyltransferase [Alicyclobacillus acidocaldarius]|uniref:glycosyltransferase n=1 Tax=Alicyclobacillus acidocaldarius TaxID=405212 RepID=UPI00345E54BA
MSALVIDIVLGRALGRGGLESVLTTVSQALQQRGHRVRMFQFEPPQHPEWVSTLPEMHFYDPVAAGQERTFPGEVPIFRQALGYRRKILELGPPDVLLATHTPYLSLLAHLAVAVFGERRPPIISWLHGPAEAYGGGELLAYADGHLAISKGVEASLRRYVSEGAPVFSIGNPVTREGLRQVARPKDRWELLSIGRMDNLHKRLDVMFQALARTQMNFRLTIIGDGPDREALERLAQELGLGARVRWVGWLDDPWSCVGEASLLLLTSDVEGFGMVLVEALARGIPVVATRCSGPVEIVQDGHNGWLFEPGRSDELAALLDRLARGHLQLPAQDVCVHSVERYRTDAVIDRMEEALCAVRALYQPKAFPPFLGVAHC